MRTIDEKEFGVFGDFGQAIIALQRGKCVRRKVWEKDCFIVKQINSDIPPTVVPNMQSLPPAAKEKIKNLSDGTIHYREQCLYVYTDDSRGIIATNYIPDWMDIFATDWEITE